MGAWAGASRTDGPGAVSFLLNAAPGAGKTRPALELSRELLATRAISRVAVVCPTSPLTRQWAQAAADLGVHLAPDAPDLRPPRDFQGVAVTYARVASAPQAFARSCPQGTLVVADEVHHLGDDLAWGEAFEAAFGSAGRRLLLSGTPFRSDATAITGVSYGADGIARPDFTYGYDEAVRDAVCRPVTFIPFDGMLQWRSGDDVIEAGFSDVLTGREASRRYRTAISLDLENGLPRILREAHERLLRVRRAGHRDAAGLVIAADSEHAAQVARVLREVTGEAPTVVRHTDPRAHDKLDAFRRSSERWIVAVNMVSEGVDIPRLRVGVYATAAKTALVFRQIVGRFVRAIPGRPIEQSWLYLPADPVLQAHAADVERELLHVLTSVEAGDGLLDEPPDRTETERAETPDFVALSADVAPQMALFGSAGVAAAAARAPRRPAASGEATPPPVSAFERRKRLREDRRRLVADLGRRDGRPHAEINAWLNRATDVSRVQDATIEQLERSIDLLFEALRRKGPTRWATARR